MGQLPVGFSQPKSVGKPAGNCKFQACRLVGGCYQVGEGARVSVRDIVWVREGVQGAQVAGTELGYSVLLGET